MNPRRLEVLKAFRRRAPRHRYNYWRVAGLSVSMGILLVIPLNRLRRHGRTLAAVALILAGIWLFARAFPENGLDAPHSHATEHGVAEHR